MKHFLSISPYFSSKEIAIFVSLFTPNSGQTQEDGLKYLWLAYNVSTKLHGGSPRSVFFVFSLLCFPYFLRHFLYSLFHYLILAFKECLFIFLSSPSPALHWQDSSSSIYWCLKEIFPDHRAFLNIWQK